MRHTPGVSRILRTPETSGVRIPGAPSGGSGRAAHDLRPGETVTVFMVHVCP